ncbi:MAG: bifunctional diaminohydroxyphosphoribosylaminopyrimidine deaminase/5-amino-6-(5-phosphoribosylamino)uracil reductase RibD [Calditrichia bacterium]
MEDRDYMQLALEMAQKGAGQTSPNPLVGSVIVKNGKIIGQGYHRKYGEKHAEAAAIDSASEPVKGATLYCNLEPCCHTSPEKKTPPCAQRIIREGIQRVVIATTDPNPLVNGKGVEMLRQAGIEVQIGVEKEAATKLNEAYLKWAKTNEPFIHLKIAQSVDGRIATSTGHSQWITNAAARKRVHWWRVTHDAVLVGANTVLKDDPTLTVREVEGRNPLRIILDDQLQIPEAARILNLPDPEKTLIFTFAEKSSPKFVRLSQKGVQLISLENSGDGYIPLRQVIGSLTERKVTSILVEGGGEIFTSFVKERLFDKISVFIAPLIIGEGIESIGSLGISSLEEALRLENISIEIIDNQALVQGYRPGSL